MTDEIKDSGSDEPVVESDKDSDKDKKTIEQLQEDLEKQRRINKDVISQRDELKQKAKLVGDPTTSPEEIAKIQQELVKQKEQNGKLADKLRNTSAQVALKEEIAKHKPASVETVLELIKLDSLKYKDFEVVTESVVDAVAKVKERHGVLFGKAGNVFPNPKLPTDGEAPIGYEEELKRINAEMQSGSRKYTPKDLAALRLKYNRN